MNHRTLAHALIQNAKVFEGLLNNLPMDQIYWKPNHQSWCILEVVCHLYDCEIEDFRSRVDHVLHRPKTDMPSIDPMSWVLDRQYLDQPFQSKVQDFIGERTKSVMWLNQLEQPRWDNTYDHPNFGPMSARLFLVNWLAHDYLHIKQINQLKLGWLQENGRETLLYAGYDPSKA
ncbi:MAG: DinB family protein [Bacteroidota bacterium]